MPNIFPQLREYIYAYCGNIVTSNDIYICELRDATAIFKVRLLLLFIIHKKKINTEWHKSPLTSQAHRQQARNILTTLLHHLCQVETSFFVVVSKAICHVASTWLSTYCSTLHTLCSMLCKQFPHVLYLGKVGRSTCARRVRFLQLCSTCSSDVNY